MKHSWLVPGVLTLLAVQAEAQVVVVPESLRVVVVQGEESAQTLALSTEDGPAPYCLDFDAPLQRSPRDGGEGGCGAVGEVLDWADENSVGFNWSPYAITMTPHGRVFTAEFGLRTYELTQSLDFVTRFLTPTVAELTPFARTVGVTYNEDTGTLWWTNAEVDGFDVRRILLLEGTLEGSPTGRRIEIPVPPSGPAPTNSGYPKGASYDPATQRYYYVDVARREIWAVDTLGIVPAGYPVSLAAYPGASIGQTLEASGGMAGGPEGVRLEVSAGANLLDWERVVVTDPLGMNLGLETPLSAIYGQGWYPVGSTARSRQDPNGAMYVTFSCCTGGPDGVAAIRPVPLSPTWLVLSDWMGTIPAGGTSEVMLTFRAGQRAPGEYRSTLVVEDTAGVVLASVPLTLVVEPATPANEPGAGEAGVSLAVSPNPVIGAAAVTITLARPAADVRVTVHDVLGRNVETLQATSLPPGATRLPFDAAGLRAGVYVVRAVGAGVTANATFSVIR